MGSGMTWCVLVLVALVTPHHGMQTSSRPDVLLLDENLGEASTKEILYSVTFKTRKANLPADATPDKGVFRIEMSPGGDSPKADGTGSKPEGGFKPGFREKLDKDGKSFNPKRYQPLEGEIQTITFNATGVASCSGDALTIMSWKMRERLGK
jgi:hypothetical protein